MIGVEIIENAVEDAKANAQLNGEFCFGNLLTIFRVLCCWLLTTKPLLWTPSNSNPFCQVCSV